jgi:hypothetical protein
MSVTIDFPPEMEMAVREHAARSGQDMTAFVVQAVQEKIAKARGFDEVCAPFAEAVSAAGVNDRELDRVFEEAREDVWQEKQGKRA